MTASDRLFITMRIALRTTGMDRLADPHLGRVVSRILVVAVALAWPLPSPAAPLRAGAAKIDITNLEAGPVNDRLHARALVLQSGDEPLVFVSIDAVAIAEIGSIRNSFLATVRAQVQKELGIPPRGILINASHCHGVVCGDIEQRTVEVIRQAFKNLQPAKVGWGVGHEDRIMENRRLLLKNGREADVRHAYSMPHDDEVETVGPIDPQIGVLRVDRADGRPLAVLYNFACHPIQTAASGGNTADITGFSSQVIEDNLGDDVVALFVQGCGGDINPVFYKDVDHPRDAEPLGNMLGLSTLKAIRKIATRDTATKLIQENLELPRAELSQRIDSLLAEQTGLLQSLQGTSLNLKTYLPLAVKYKLNSEFPSYYSHRYLHDRQLGRVDLDKLDADNRRNLEAYTRNIQTMEQLTRLQTNLNLLRKHQMQNLDAGKRTVDVEVSGIRIGDFVLVTFPGELTVQIGLEIKRRSPHPFTFVAGYTNGYIYYAPTASQLRNVGGAQEDSDCILAPEWQALFDAKVDEILAKL